LDFSQLPTNLDTQFAPQLYGGANALKFREAINWIDASSPNYSSVGCLAASDSTLHVFVDETTDPVTYPVLQHILLSGRKSLAWNPEYWYTQKGDHRYRMALLPHENNWRSRYREGIAFNRRLLAFAGHGGAPAAPAKPVAASLAYLMLEPQNLVLTAMKKSEDGDRVVVRFYEAEGNQSFAVIRLPKPIRRAWKTNLIEDEEIVLESKADGSLELPVGAYEIVTLMIEA
jgi:alpha-mannosidase